MDTHTVDGDFARDVRRGLMQAGQKALPCRYFYDELGSALFEAITCLPEYGLTRADARLLQACAPEVVNLLPGPLIVAELGSGTGTKTRAVLEQVRRRHAVLYYPIDVSASALAKCARDLSPLGAVVPIQSDYLAGLQMVTERRKPGQTLLVLFLGSTIGNFDPEEALDFLLQLRTSLRPGDALLLGADLVKPAEVLLAAYNDAAGVTAAFNLNLLARINRELGADFNLRQFEHVARYHESRPRIEMHLRSRVRQSARIRSCGLSVDFASGETIRTEISYKFRPQQLCTMARRTGFRLAAQWSDEEWPFAENLLVAA
jgi:L-histidine N-alpha-methyltransferase